MSWAEVFKINSNTKRALNEQIRDSQYKSSYLITESGTWTVPSTGYYKVFCVGAGGNINSGNGGSIFTDGGTFGSTTYLYIGSAGGVAVKTLELNKGTSYTITIEDPPTTYTASSTNKTSFGDIMYATTGGMGDTKNVTTHQLPNGGVGSGGDYNFSGESGQVVTYSPGMRTIIGASVGCYIPELMRDNSAFSTAISDGTIYGTPNAKSGLGILGYGSSQGYAAYVKSSSNGGVLGPVTTPKKGGCVLIIPLETEE